ncbi:hypothetical protein IEO21_09047 [Rhodonia placenta]|uniref:Uncharacterized protein n=1 Tax=Rhodonia placenta TaxID=104341 RepID=A0A8H7NVA2_9APHY|nr:hypothetical protein IEO21_09047 [Postia placenta]
MPPHHRGWVYPPTRRELTLLLFALTVFVISYNLESSLRLAGVSRAKMSSSYLSSIGLGTQDPGLDPDGRRPQEWRDELENLIVGEWSWEEGKVAAVEPGHSGAAVSGAAIYNVESGSTVGRDAGKDDRGVGVTKGVSPSDQFLRWEDQVPRASALVHVPGAFAVVFLESYTILENLIMVNGTFFLVTNDRLSLPDLGVIASSPADRLQPPREEDWQILSTEEAKSKIGPYGGRIFGTSWLALDPSLAQDPYTLFSLFRTHSALAVSSTSSQKAGNNNAAHSVPAPLRLMFPYVPTFSSPHIPPDGDDIKKHPPPREKSYNGLHPLMTKAALPATGIWYLEDWQDIIDMNAPWVFDRVVVADRGAAARGRDFWTRHWAPADSAIIDIVDLKRRQAEVEDNNPMWAAPFVGLPAPPSWWAPMRSALLSYLRLPDPHGSQPRKKVKATKTALTYVSMQEEPFGAGARLLDSDHDALVAGLHALQREGVLGEVSIVKGNGSVGVHGWEWADRMSAIAKSSIVLGPYGFQLADSMFMAPPAWSPPDGIIPSPTADSDQTPAPLLMEFFPPAWWNDKKFAGNSLPPVIQPEDVHALDQRLSINADAVVQAIREEVARRRVP